MQKCVVIESNNNMHDEDFREKVASALVRLHEDNKNHEKRAHALKLLYKDKSERWRGFLRERVRPVLFKAFDGNGVIEALFARVELFKNFFQRERVPKNHM